MSTSNFFLKPPVLLAAIVLIGLIALSSSLQRQVEGPDRAEDVEERSDVASLETGSTRIARIAAPSVGSRGDGSDRTGAAATKQTPRKAVVEDFDAALKRAEGTATISGRILGRPNESEDESRERRRLMRDLMTSATSGADLRDLRQTWADQRETRYKPVAAAEVFLYEDDPNTTHPPLRMAVADKEGSFTLTNLNDADQRYILVVKSEDYAPEATYVSMNQESRTVEVYMQEGVPLKGRVLDSETSEPVVGAVVYHPNPNWGTFAPLGVTTTTISGEYSFPRVSTGRLLSQASAAGYATRRVRLRAPDEDSTIELQPGGASVSGVTIDRLTGKPQGGARVWAVSGYRVSESAVSRADGTFEIANLPEGDYEVFAVRGMKSEVQNVSLERRQQVEDIEIVLPASVLVSGQVVHSTERRPLEGIKVWFESSKGSQYRRTNVEGRFAFETMAIDEYSIMIHEKGFLPVGTDTEASGTQEIITRKIASNQSSDELLIRLRPVRMLEGKVTREAGRGGWGRGGFGRDSSAERAQADDNGNVPARDAEVTLSYVHRGELKQLKTKSDAAGNFFINMPDAGRSRGFVMAQQNFMMDGTSVRVPRNRPVELNLARNIAQGELYLSDESPLDAVPVTASVLVSPGRAESDSGGSAHEINIARTNTMRGGRLFMALPPDQNVVLGFSMPDGVDVRKEFRSNELLRGRATFVYDPVSQDVVADVSEREGRGGRGGRRNRGNGGPRGGQNQGGNRQNQNNNEGAQQQQQQGATNLTGAPSAAAPAE